MKIALLGYGKESRATEKYFKTHYSDAQFDIFENETPAQLKQRDYSSYDIIFRSPSVPPLGLPNESSVTKYFFDHCPCKIIGVTATKGKGTTCSFIKALLDAENYDAYLVGNIGVPALDILDQLTKNSVVVYEMSSFQLWDLEKSPFISVLGQLEPDHLNIHKDYAEYLAAKSHITIYQDADDYLIYFAPNPETAKIAASSPAGHKISYPFEVADDILSVITLPGTHNKNNALAAIAVVAAFKNISPDEYCASFTEVIREGLSSFHGLPHRLEFIREVAGVSYYDDNFSTNPSSTRVAVQAFPDKPVILIAGGRDKTENADLPEIAEILSSPNLAKVVLMGESGHQLFKDFPSPAKFILAESLKEAVSKAKSEAEKLKATSPENTAPVVLMSPAAASFDMFKDVYDRGTKYQDLIKSLKI